MGIRTTDPSGWKRAFSRIYRKNPGIWTAKIRQQLHPEVRGRATFREMQQYRHDIQIYEQERQR